MTLEDLKALVRTLEFGMWNNQQVQDLLDSLVAAPQTLLPQEMALVGQAAFLLTRAGREGFAQRALMACLAWSIENGREDEYAATLIENIQYIARQLGEELGADEIRRLATKRDHSKASSVVVRWDSSHMGFDDSAQAEKAVGIASGVTPNMPVTTFSGFLKQHDPRTLNPVGTAAIREAFSRFGGELSSPEAQLEEAKRLIKIGVQLSPGAMAEIATLGQMIEAGVTVRIRVHRRYAGGDGRLPRGCYSALCSGPQGKDEGTLNRELMEYVHPCFPGTVLVGDSSDKAMNSLLGNPVVAKPGYCALYVLLIPPQEPDQRRIFNAVYSETLRLGGRSEGPLVIALESKVEYKEIERVVDLRLPETQKWFFNFFQYGDGVHLSKPNGGNIRDFTEMLPTLMHPELGGCQVTHGIGSWMRTNRVNALVFPSARSNAAVFIDHGELFGSRGWNLVDYRQAAAVASAETVLDNDPWYTFEELAEKFGGPARSISRAPEDKYTAGTWLVKGIQDRYDALYGAIVGTKDANEQP